MADTQWPRYYVFERPSEEGPFIHAGSVHAPDREMALLIGRDVFARRPERTAMWVVRDRDIHARTSEQLQLSPPKHDPDIDAPEHSFHIFAKRTHKGVCVQLGEVRAQSAEGALAAGLVRFEKNALVWWVIRADSVIESGADDQPVLFDSSPGKEFRHERHYPVRTMMRDLKNKKREDPES